MTPAKAHPYLASFSRIGLIEQDETTGRYEIGALALELGLISLRRLSGVRIATPKIAALAAKIDHAVSLAVWGTHGPTVVQLEEPGQPVHIVDARRLGHGAARDRDRAARSRPSCRRRRSTPRSIAGLDRYGVGYNPEARREGRQARRDARRSSQARACPRARRSPARRQCLLRAGVRSCRPCRAGHHRDGPGRHVRCALGQPDRPCLARLRRRHLEAARLRR